MCEPKLFAAVTVCCCFCFLVFRFAVVTYVRTYVVLFCYGRDTYLQEAFHAIGQVLSLFAIMKDTGILVCHAIPLAPVVELVDARNDNLFEELGPRAPGSLNLGPKDAQGLHK